MENKENQGVVKKSFVKARKLRLIGKAILVIAAIANIAAANDGVLDIENRLEGKQPNNYLRILHVPEATYPGVSDYLDSYDIVGGMYLSSCSGIYSEITSSDLWKDWRPNTSIKTADIKLIYDGTIASGNELNNWLEVEFVNDLTFGSKPITLQTSNGQRYDVRKVIEDGEGVGIVPLEDLPAGSYTSANPYANIELHFRHLADLNNNGTVDLVDFSTLSNNWLGEGLGDISGPDGLPDGIVDIYDLLKMVDQWLEETG